ncbi:hypothetical protein [Mucilaginibacter celer]|uniref:Uncharacterized protein n=1 Tax=Mucilaginibacter celer TaxID=2305508 RepID=A0A494VNY2_9SPHI|nr:hypothetical protein [Mucilaginibacter celer]AYL97146.1 hypothetical protein HYN43_018350 [Mucilaginibacter celer]
MKKPCLIIILLFAVLGKSYGRFQLAKLDTGKSITVPAKSDTPLLLSPVTAMRSDSGFANAQLIRSGRNKSRSNVKLNFYRHKLNNFVQPVLEALSASDRENFTITINQDSIRQAKDTLCVYDGKLHRGIYAFVPVILSNQSADTLKYINMVCSRLDIFRTDKQNAQLLLMTKCWKNGPEIFKVAPYQQAVFNIPVCFLTDMGDSKPFAPKNFKIGMSLFKYKVGNQLPLNIYALAHSKKMANVIWSNEVVMR